MNQITIQKTLEDYVESREKIISLHGQARKLIKLAEEESNKISTYLFPGNAVIKMSQEKFIKELDRRFWQSSFDKTGFYQLMDAKAKDDFERDLYNDAPIFSMENIRSTFATLFQDAGTMFKRGIVNIFKRLDHNYKTNSKEPFKIGKKSILTRMLDIRMGYLYINYYHKAFINDMDRVVKILDNKRHSPGELETKIEQALRESYSYEDDYYRVKCFKNGNMHIEIKREDLLDKINKLINEYYNENALGQG